MVGQMDIHSGFKETEAGVIPSDWDFDETQNLADITTGDKNTQDRIEDGDYPFYVRSQTVERINTYSFDGEAVLTAGDGVGTGKIFHYIKGKFDFHQRVYKISNFSERLDGYFYFLYFSKNFYNRIIQMTAKSSVDSVRREMIAKMLIPFPSKKAEQIRICSALRDISELTAQLEKLISKKRNIKQGAIQDLLKPKEGWVQKKIKEIAPLQRGFDLPTANIKHGTHPVVYSNGVLNHHNKFMVKGPGVVTGRSGTLGKVQYVEQDFWPHNTTLWVTSFKEADPRFVYYLYGAIGFERFGTGSGVPTLNRNDVHDFETWIPAAVVEQERLAKILSDMDAEIDILETKLKKYRQLKQGMMQNLLTGKIRLVQ